MVFVNSQKFACESCIKGHRSSTCSHTDRPLYEIKKKGRPISQCEKCRSLRQSRKMHSKCVCTTKTKKTEVLPLPSSAGTKAKRFIPIAPALPNGLKDLESSSNVEVILPVDVRQRVDTLLNPCMCKNVWTCKCNKNGASGSRNTSALATLARAATLKASTLSSHSRSTTPPPQPPSKRAKHHHPHKHIHSHSHSNKHAHSHSESPPPPVELPPLLYTPDLFSESYTSPTMPNFGTIPSLSEISSLAGSGCTCGVECNCPGCIEHRGPAHVDTEAASCADGCGTCVDNTNGIALPGLDPPSSSIIDRFFACAATLPAPPVNRKMGVGVQLDPMNIMVYPKTAIEMKEMGVPFGLITVPRLECCGGKCGCPEGQCGCGKSCDGCCANHHDKAETKMEGKGKGKEVELVVDVPNVVEGPEVPDVVEVPTATTAAATAASTSTPPPETAPAAKSCCCGS